MNVLIDTNVFIPLEPSAGSDIETRSSRAADFFRLAQGAPAKIFLHPCTLKELANDRNSERMELRRLLVQKYLILPEPPLLSEELLARIGPIASGSHDMCDALLIAAVHGEAVDFLVSEDIGLHRKAVFLGIGDRVMSVDDAIANLRTLFPSRRASALAGLTQTVGHTLDRTDPIFSSIREDYVGFDDWFVEKVQRGHRPCWVVRKSPSGPVVAVSIVKDESRSDKRILKICTFKVADEYRGYKYGELLLHGILQHARSNFYTEVYLTAYPHHEELILFLQQFGFISKGETTGKERIFCKKLAWTDNEYETLDPLTFHILFGPAVEKLTEVGFHVVPIEPRYHEALFPHGQQQADLFPAGHAFQNTLRKVYICKAPTRKVQPGDILLFYRSSDQRAITDLGVCEAAIATQSAQAAARFAGKRTVYSMEQLTRMATGSLLVILFRFSRALPVQIGYEELLINGALSGPAQSIVQIKQEVTGWLRQRLGA